MKYLKEVDLFKFVETSRIQSRSLDISILFSPTSGHPCVCSFPMGRGSLSCCENLTLFFENRDYSI
eukprot:snap_masked-scaffold_11-processed-gene-2.25-mRNA-1 protein AED:1.00 eAED:1.00 QI:0/0/0/0/1/1/2/0/65